MNKKKYLFVDMDGTIATFENKKGGVIVNDFEEIGLFLKKKPIKQVIKKINSKFKKYRIKILSATPNANATIEKQMWLNKHFNIELCDRHFIQWNKEKKVDFLIRFCIKYNVKRKDILIIDDTHDILIECEKAGFKAMHVCTILKK